MRAAASPSSAAASAVSAVGASSGMITKVARLARPGELSAAAERMPSASARASAEPRVPPTQANRSSPSRAQTPPLDVADSRRVVTPVSRASPSPAPCCASQRLNWSSSTATSTAGRSGPASCVTPARWRLKGWVCRKPVSSSVSERPCCRSSTHRRANSSSAIAQTTGRSGAGITALATPHRASPSAASSGAEGPRPARASVMRSGRVVAMVRKQMATA